jgi:hypothetical protein
MAFIKNFKVVFIVGFLVVKSFHHLKAQTISGQYLLGVVKDKNETAVPYVNIGIPAYSFGLTTNENGEFKFKMTTEKESDTVYISSIGYKKQLMRFVDFKSICDSQKPIYLIEEVYELSSITITGVDYETKVLGSKNVADMECDNINISAQNTDSLKLADLKKKYKEKGLDENLIGFEFGNLIKIKKGQRTIIDQISFKTCQKQGDTAIYRINVYQEGGITAKKLTVIGIVKKLEFTNLLRVPIIIKATDNLDIQTIDLSSQQIEVSDDFIVGLECIYTSNGEVNVGIHPTIYGATNLYVRPTFQNNWVKFPIFDLTFISASVRYEKKKSFFKFWK